MSVGRHGCLAWLTLGLALAAFGCRAAQRPNVLLVVVDTARADHVSANGYHRDTTPVVAELGRQGAVYLDAYTPSPWTLPAHASLFTGLYPSSHGADSGHLRLDEHLPFLAVRLRDAGYKTLAYVENPWVGKDYNFQLGFDTFDEVWRGVHGTEGDMGAAIVSEKVERWLAWRDGNADAQAQPFFLFINYFEPHLPYNPPEPERSRLLSPERDAAAVERLRHFKHPEEVLQILGRGSLHPDDFAVLSDLYDGEIAYVDRRIGEVVESLRRRGLLERTLVAVTSDHGEMLGEHGLMDHKLNLYEPVLRIPLVVRYPPEVRAGQRETSAVMLQDLYATILRATSVVPAGEPNDSSKNGWPPESRPLPGFLRIPAGPARGRSQDDPLIAEYARPGEFLDVMRGLIPGYDPSAWDRDLVACRASDAKLIWSSGAPPQYFDLMSDPSESNDLAAARPDAARRAAEWVDRWRTRAAPAASGK